ncbi:MAG: hypothetical protein F4160_03580 [Rhodospirillaceae bacterium]|nr:hypothetical protein [Rhodospirillaceae bacterium]MYH35861.1 hypothetical protein [Rhodospirillaceae bacterium]MYK14052.1 hypothetical protein [Rhodospirillaceae bacterium]
MDIIPNLIAGMGNLFQVTNFAFLLVGSFIGIVAGAMPGIAFVNAMALGLPFAYFMTPVSAMLFLTGIYVGGIFGGSISSVLLNIPGSPGSLPATWDGYPMTKQGRSAKALGIAITCSAIGGMVSALLMIFFAPPFAQFALTFDQPEFFAATFLGLVTVISIAKGNMLPALLSLFAGLIIATIGIDYFYAMPRLTFGWEVLDSRVSFVVAMIGMFAVGEVLFTLTQHLKIGHRNLDRHTQLPSLKELWKLKGTIARGSGLGCMIGVIPGAGGLVGAIIAYGVEKQVSPRGDKFGTGVEEGLAAPETAKNATTGAATIPMLTLGIPGSAATAIMMAALMLKGVNPGPILFVSGKELVYTVFAGYLVANLLIVVMGLPIARGFSLIMKVPPAILYSMIIVLAVIGAFAVRNNIADVYICLFFGVLSYFMKRFNIPTTPMVLGIILGPLAERFYLTSLASYDTALIFFTRPKSGVIMALAIAFLLWSLWPSIMQLGRTIRNRIGGAA